MVWPIYYGWGYIFYVLHFTLHAGYRDSVTRFFVSGFFHGSVFPQPQSIPESPFRIFSKIREDISKSRCTTVINDTGGKFATGINDTGGKVGHQFLKCFWHRWKNMATISGCRLLKVSLKAKIYICVNSTTQRCSNKIIKIFLIEDFFHLPPVVHLEPRISPRIFEKIRNGCNVMVYSGAWGKLIHEKNQKSKISWHCPFTRLF